MRGFEFTVITVNRKNLPKKNTFNEILKDVKVIYVEDPIQNIFDKVKEVSTKTKKASIVDLFINFGKTIVKGVLNNFLFPDKGYFWYKRSFRKVYELININNFDVVYGSFPEPSAIWLAYKISKKSHLPLVIDYRDLWSTNPLFGKISLMNKYTAYAEKRILKHADIVIFATAMAEENYINKKIVEKGKAFLLWNGFDPEDFVIDLSKDSIIDKSVFNFTYTGNTGDLTNPSRNPKAFIDAFIEFTKTKNKIRLNFIGNLPSDVNNYVSNVKEIYVSGMMPHADISRILSDSDILVVILTEAEDLSAVPGKVYEYMAANKFILALTKENSQLSNLIKKYEYGMVVDPDSKELILSKMIESMDICNNKPELKPNQLFVKNFDRQRTASKLEELLLKHINNN